MSSSCVLEVLSRVPSSSSRRSLPRRCSPRIGTLALLDTFVIVLLVLLVFSAPLLFHISWTAGTSLLAPFALDAVQQSAFGRYLGGGLTVLRNQVWCEHACTDGYGPKKYSSACIPGGSYDSCCHWEG